MTITPELLAEIKTKAEKAVPGPWGAETFGARKHAFCVRGPTHLNDPVCRTVGAAAANRDDALYIARMDPPTALALVAALETAQRDLDAAAKAYGLALAERDAIRSESEKLIRDIDRHIALAADLATENEKFRARLEIDYCYDIDGNRRELSRKEGDALPDGIECRDATISGLEGRIASLRAENERLRQAVLGNYEQLTGLDWKRLAEDCRRAALKEATHE